jgi:hypothetical protein
MTTCAGTLQQDAEKIDEAKSSNTVTNKTSLLLNQFDARIVLATL